MQKITEVNSLRIRLLAYAEEALWPIFLIIIVAKYSYYGYDYLPIIDDNNMYGIYRLYENIFQDVIMRYKMFTTRPAAAFLDAYFWTRFWDSLDLALFLMTLLLWITCYFMVQIFKKSSFPIGVTVLVVFALLPVGSEATYWLAASTRIVVGMFFTTLSLYLLCLFFEASSIKQKYLYLSSFYLANLLSYGFYEQIIVLSFAGTFLVMAANWRRLKPKWVLMLPVFNLGMIGAWYKIFGSQGNMATRGQVVRENYWEHFHRVTAAIGDVWLLAFKDLQRDGIRQGFQLVIANKSYLFLAAASCILLFLLAYQEPLDNSLRQNLIKLLLGAALFIIPFAPFYPIKQVWVCNRNLFPSLLGLGLVFEALFSALARNKWLLLAKSLAVSLLAFILLVSNTYELTYYRNAGLIDREITAKIMDQPEMGDFIRSKKSLFLLNSKPSYMHSIAKRIENCTGADWALLGAIKAHFGIRDTGYSYPIPDGASITYKKTDLSKSVFLGIDDNRNIFPLRITGQAADMLYFSTLDGRKFGKLKQVGENTVSFLLDK